jgi:hypothetical protein
MSSTTTLTRTKYLKSVRPAPTVPAQGSGLRVLKDGSGNQKLGGKITKGPFRGMRLYTLTLEERATCPTDCQNLARCYGDGMPFAFRYQVGPELLEALTADLAVLTAQRGRYCVRLHILGDFFSVAYVAWWRAALVGHPGLHLYGYTHWRHGTPIGDAVTGLVAAAPDRVAFRRSDGQDAGDPLPKAYTVDLDQVAVSGSVLCPEQTHGVQCGACGLCMNQHTNVSFIDHGTAARARIRARS